MSPAAYAAVGAVRAYQWTIRPLIGANCRFWPSCSDYAVEAFRTHGATRGGALAGWRILRCNPWCQGGYDPVPPRQPGAKSGLACVATGPDTDASLAAGGALADERSVTHPGMTSAAKGAISPAAGVATVSVGHPTTGDNQDSRQGGLDHGKSL